MALYGEENVALIAATRTDIGGILPDVTVEEVYRDELAITEHPLEKGAAATDHAFKRSPEIDIRAGFSNSSAGAEGYIDAVYEELLALQSSRQPFDVFTARRRYPNMLIRGLAVTRDPHSNSVLNVTASCRQIIIVSTRTQAGAQRAATGSTGGGDAVASPKPADQAMPGATSGVVDGGTVQLQPPAVGGEAFGASFSPGTNPDYSAAPRGFGLSLSGFDAGSSDAVFADGSVFQSGATVGAGAAPSSLAGNLSGPEAIGGLQSAAPDFYDTFGGGP